MCIRDSPSDIQYLNNTESAYPIFEYSIYLWSRSIYSKIEWGIELINLSNGESAYPIIENTEYLRSYSVSWTNYMTRRKI